MEREREIDRLGYFVLIAYQHIRVLFNAKAILVEQYSYYLTLFLVAPLRSLRKGMIPFSNERNSATGIRTGLLRCHNPIRYLLHHGDSPP